MYKLLIVTISLLLSLPIIAQTGFDNEELKGVVYSKEFTVDFRMHTNGYLAIALNKARIKTWYKTNYYQIEVGILKHPKESRNLNTKNQLILGEFQGGAYTFGKKNSMFLVRGGYGQKRYFSEKQNEKGLAIGISYMGGFTLGILKPYYLDLLVSEDGSSVEFVQTGYTEEYATEFLDVNSIINSSGFRHGWAGLSVVPGAHAKVGVHLDWGAYDEFVKALEFGVMVDAFYKKVPLMVSENNKIVFVNVYLAVQFGKRSN